MLVAVVSDMHLGRRDRLDRFDRTPGSVSRFIKLLNYLENNVDRIVLLGDVFETLRGRNLRSAQDELKGIIRAYPDISRRIFENPQYKYVHGNHDLVAGTMGIPDFHLIDEDGMRMLFFHGHQLDPISRGQAKVSQFFIWLGGWLERMGVGITSRLDGSPDATILTETPKAGRFEKAAVVMAKEVGADVVVTGHTHLAKRLEIDSHLYLNSGTCVSGRRELLLLDTAAKIFRVVREPDFV